MRNSFGKCINFFGVICGIWLAIWLAFNFAVPLVADMLDQASNIAGIDTHMWFDIWDVATYQSILIITALLSAIIISSTYHYVSGRKQKEADWVRLMWTMFLSEKYDFFLPEDPELLNREFDNFRNELPKKLENSLLIKHFIEKKSEYIPEKIIDQIRLNSNIPQEND